MRQLACDASFSESSPESPQPVSVSIAAVIANSKSRRATAAASVPDGFAQKRVFVIASLQGLIVTRPTVLNGGLRPQATRLHDSETLRYGRP